jgi:CheY-like chemotaxis protein
MANSTNNKNIVVYADDDIDDIYLVKDSFSLYSKNVELVTFPDGLGALSFLRNMVKNSIIPCLIILDINMPGMDGKETLSNIRNFEELKEVPVILFTTSNNPVEKKFAEKYGAGFITKPIDSEQMERITHQFIDHCTPENRESIRK